ncbi:MAG: endoribonuclease [Acidobacteria bacterium]|nr:endoribonuclease [Acidobacteriota bacterium]
MKDTGIEARISALGYTLPAAAAPIAGFVPFTVQDGLAFISGQLPLAADGLRHIGKLGADISVEEGQKAAALCALNLVAQLRSACDGDLALVRRCLRLGVFINAAPDFTQHPEVANGASDLIVGIFGEGGRHARAAVGVGSLPRGVCVEVEGLFLLS